MRVRACERYRVTERETMAGIPGGMYRKLEDSHGCFQRRGGPGRGGEQNEASGGDTRKSGVAETGKRDEKREKRRGRGLPATQAHQ